MNRFLREWFTIHRVDRIGIVILLIILIIVIIIPSFFRSKENIEDMQRLKNELDAFLQKTPDTIPSKSYFAFDPNTLDSSSFVRLGFSPKQTRVILNYRRKGGIFKEKVDFKKLYVVDDEKYNQLVSYIKLETKSPFYFNPNILDSLGFIKLGFSPKQVHVILNYRHKGGNFRVKEDFKKLYVVDDKRYNQLKSYIKIP